MLGLGVGLDLDLGLVVALGFTSIGFTRTSSSMSMQQHLPPFWHLVLPAPIPYYLGEMSLKVTVMGSELTRALAPQSEDKAAICTWHEERRSYREDLATRPGL